jgi:fluoroquinolone resistance protein
MQTSFFNETEYLSIVFNNVSVINKEMGNLEFDGCQFIDCNFTDSLFKKCRFIECTFTRCNLSVTKVSQSQFTDVIFDECKLVGIDWTRASWPKLVFSVALKFKQCILNDSSFFGLNLDEITIEECKAHDVDFRDGRFRRAIFTGTDFTHSLFAKTDLSGADFTDASDYDIDIFNNNISKAKFSRYEAIRLLNSLDIELVD